VLAGGNTPPGGQNDRDTTIGKGVDAKKCLQVIKYKRLKSGSIDRLRDKATNVGSMDNTKPKLVTKQGVVIDIVLTVIFFVIMTNVLKHHVPWVESGELAVLLGGAYASACLSGVFWLALSLFRVTLADQVLQKAESEKNN